MRPIFLVGDNRTGTTSLGWALDILGYPVASYIPELSTAERERQWPVLYQYVVDYGEAVYRDSPWSLVPFCLSLATEFPDALFILTTRDDESWLDSHHGWFGPSNNNGWYEVCDRPFYCRKTELYAHTLHDEIITKYFEHNRNFVAVRLEQLNWEWLCGLVGRDVPGIPFPKINRTYHGNEGRFGQYRKGKSLTYVVIAPELSNDLMSYYPLLKAVMGKTGAVDDDPTGWRLVTKARRGVYSLCRRAQFGLREVIGQPQASDLLKIALSECTSQYLAVAFSDTVRLPYNLSPAISFLEDNRSHLGVFVSSTGQATDIYESKSGMWVFNVAKCRTTKITEQPLDKILKAGWKLSDYNAPTLDPYSLTWPAVI